MLSYDFFQEFFENASVLDNKYKIIQTIGEGRYAKVKLAINIEDKKKYAIKVMREDQVNTASKLEAFLNEVQILSSLHHRHIVQMVYVSLNGECKKPNGKIIKVVYYVMKYAEYGELFEILQKTSNFSEEMARYYFHQLIESVAYLHNNCVGHRDIKTENILIDHKFNLKVADFGCACRSRDHNLQRIGFSNQVAVGSPDYKWHRYNAPEISNNYAPSDYYAEDVDVFACASALFVMVLQSIPFNSSLFNDPYYSRLCKKDTSSFWKIFDSENMLTYEFKDLIEKMMEPNPKKRMTIDEIKQHPWYSGPIPSSEEVIAEMRKRGEIILSQNQENLRVYHAKKLKKNRKSRHNPAIANGRKASDFEIDNLINMVQPEVSEINMKLLRETKERAIAKAGKGKAIRSSPGSLQHKHRKRTAEEDLVDEKSSIFGHEASMDNEKELASRQFPVLRKNSSKGERTKMKRSGSDD